MAEIHLEKLNKMYKDAKNCDEQLFAEQRTNVLLKMGDHYKRRNGRVFEELRSRGVVSKDQKIRLTKNHIHRITNVYENGILNGNPSLSAIPFNENELHDVKAAQMNQDVIDWVKETNNWPAKQHKNVHDFVNIGEVYSKIGFDLSKGQAIALDEAGNEVMSGEFVIDRILGFDLKRDPNARSDDEVKWHIHEQMIDISEFRDLVSELAPDKIDLVHKSGRSTVKIFDSNKGEYKESKDQVFVKELFIKPSKKFKNGWYVMFTDEMSVVQSEIPYGIYPIVGKGFDELTTSPRAASIIRVLRPYQVEINRSASKMAEHQITLGDDKVFIQKGTKLSNGGMVHGVRALQVSGQQPIIQPGRSGAQYLDYQLSQVREMYEAADLAHLLEDKQQLGDPYQLLFRSMQEKKRFSKYAEKYEQYEVEVFKTVLRMAKKVLRPYHVIKASGREEAVNIMEFMRSDDKGFEIKVVPQSGDIETKFGKILSITQTLQYAGSSLQPDQIGNLIRQLPYGNEEQAFSTLTVDNDNATNDILALDRGEMPFFSPEDNHEFMIKALMHRMKKSDYPQLDPRVQQMYQMKLTQHQQVFTAQKERIARDNMGMIPQGGFLTTVNASWFNPATNRVERIKVPSEALEWLVKRMQDQGVYAQQTGNLPPEAQAQLADQNAGGTMQAPMIQGLSQPQAV